MVCYWDSFSKYYISIEGRRTGLLPCASCSIYYLELDDLFHCVENFTLAIVE